jgi:hypothetical protein
LEKGLKYNLITLLGFILTIFMSFGESMNLQGLFRKYAKKPPYKTPEGSGTQHGLAPKKEASRRIKRPPGRSGT